MKEFNVKIAYATSVGYHHLDAYQGNQDAVVFKDYGDIKIGVICDGCSASPNSELGAKYFSQRIPDYLKTLSVLISADRGVDTMLSMLEDKILYIMNLLMMDMEYGDKIKFAYDNLLFTIIGFIIIKDRWFLFNYGDGSYCYGFPPGNALGSLYLPIRQNNTPDYIAYRFIDSAKQSKFTYSHHEIQDNSFIIVGSDGIDYIHDNAGKKYHRNKTVPSFDELANDDKIFSNKSLLTKKLQTLTKHRILYDDTSIFVIKIEEKGNG